jgi:DNA-binding CsgD family transcriptional regulator
VAQRIARDLGISDREAEIAVLLSTGADLPSVGRRLGISIHTVRAHVKHIFAKTGIRSQIELVRRILTGPAGMLISPDRM